jgi:hypothetical protein
MLNKNRIGKFFEIDLSALRPTLSKNRIGKFSETNPSAFWQNAEQ